MGCVKCAGFSGAYAKELFLYHSFHSLYLGGVRINRCTLLARSVEIVGDPSLA